MKTGLDGFYYRLFFPRDEVVECFLLKELEPTARNMLAQRAKSDRATWIDAD